MTCVSALMVLAVTVTLTSAGNIDIISRLDRSFIPYNGLSSTDYPMRRYRYPIYKGKRGVTHEPVPYDDDDDDVNKRFLRGINLRPLMFNAERDKRLRGVAPRYDLSMSPYDLKVMTKLYRNGRRKRTPEVYDLKHIYRILDAGRKRFSAPEPYDVEEYVHQGPTQKRDSISLYDLMDASEMEDAGRKRSPVTSYYDLLDMAKLAEAGKRSPLPSYNIWDLAKIHEAGKRQDDQMDPLESSRAHSANKRGFDGQNLLDLARMHQAGKRFTDQQSIFDLARMQQAGKRSLDGHHLWDLAKMQTAGKRAFDGQGILDLARLHEAGKRSVDNMALLDIARMQAAGKRSSPYDYQSLNLVQALNDAGKRTGTQVSPYHSQKLYGLYEKRSEDVSKEGGDKKGAMSDQTAKTKRSFDDYFGWDRKKKSVSEEDMADEYLKTLQREVTTGAGNKSNSDHEKKSQDADED